MYSAVQYSGFTLYSIVNWLFSELKCSTVQYIHLDINIVSSVQKVNFDWSPEVLVSLSG